MSTTADRAPPVLNPRPARALELLLAGRTIGEIAAEVKVNRGTVWRWLGDPTFAAALARERDARRTAVGEALDAAAGEAVAVLLAELRNADGRPADRLRAASAILDRAGWAARRGRDEAPGAEGIDERAAARVAARAFAALLAEIAAS